MTDINKTKAANNDEKMENEKAFIKSVMEFKAKEITTIYNGKELKGSYNLDDGFMLVDMISPLPSISTVIEYSGVSFSNNADSRAKELLVNICKDYELVLAHKGDILAAMPDYFKQREQLDGSTNGEDKAETLLEKTLNDIIGKTICFNAFDAMYHGLLEKIDVDKKLFNDIEEQGAKIPAYKAIRLLGCLALDKEKANTEQRTVAYCAGSEWLRVYKTNDPLKTFEDITFFDIMKFLCPEYYDKYWDSFKIESIDDETVDKCIYQLMLTIDSETTQALCHGVWLGYL